ncbi:MAG: 3-phosphoshikimate 1-carboxyvinyltransferase [Flavobacteriia bacterium]|nr:MAG: 3-phosphoshikimate 1-carboxyvinyltransferase [Flavobacteriia bacterium]
MDLYLDHTGYRIKEVKITISGSKSESNRMLILQKIFPNIVLRNLSDSDDTQHLLKALNSQNNTIDIGHAGTAMRFLTAYFSVKENSDIILTGSERMQNRPVKILVDALKELGADISYLKNDGFPPLRIKGKELARNKVKIKGNVSSQYISALILIAAGLPKGLEIELLGKITSVPYIKMTLALLNQIGIETQWEDKIIKIAKKEKIEDIVLTVESDWSSASYFFSLIALSDNKTIQLSAYKKNSLQGDSSLVEIYKHFGVETGFEENTIILHKHPKEIKHLNLDLVNSPDLAQTIAVSCFGLGISCDLTGLHTLKIKETDRLVALQNELQKLGAEVEITDKSLHLKASHQIKKNISIKTYDDHRMAMAFAPLSLKVPIKIENAEVVSKSYPDFWNDLEKALG